MTIFKKKNLSLSVVKIFWQDAVTYSRFNRAKKLTSMVTRGYLEQETDDYVIIRNPKTIKVSTNKRYPAQGNPTFFFIPKGMITEMKKK